MPTADTATRAYTFTLAPTPTVAALIERTHVTVNAGAAAALQVIASLAGGFSIWYGLTPAARIVLTRCWLSAESRQGAPSQHLVPHQRRHDGSVTWGTADALDRILAQEGLDEDSRAAWIAEVRPTIDAQLRDTDVWVNRRSAFNALPVSISQPDLNDFFFDSGLFSPKTFFTLDALKAPDCVRGIGQWIARRVGVGKGSDFRALAATYREILAALERAPAARTPVELAVALHSVARVNASTPPMAVAAALDRLLTGPGHSSKTKNKLAQAFTAATIDDEAFRLLCGCAAADALACASKPDKGPRPYATTLIEMVAQACGLDFLPPNASGTHVPDDERGEILRLSAAPSRSAHYIVMLDLAARRFATTLTYIRSTERERMTRHATVVARPPSAVIDWCDAYELRERPLRSTDLRGWDYLVNRWRQCATEHDRLAAVAAADEHTSRHPSGRLTNRHLFEAIARDPLSSTLPSSTLLTSELAHDDNLRSAADPEPALRLLRADARHLADYIAFARRRTAETRNRAWSLLHIDPWSAPVCVEFGKSRIPISFTPTAAGEPNVGADIELALVHQHGIATARVMARGKRFARELGQHAMNPIGAPVSRGNRLGRIAAKVEPTEPITLGTPLKWNGRLHFKRLHNGKIRWKLITAARLQRRRRDERVAGALAEIRIANELRGVAARRNLGRYPGMRILGISSGLTGSAGAILQTISRPDLAAIARRSNGAPPPAHALFIQIDGTDYRRIGPDILPNGSAHPAPWAAIERFAITLPGDNPRTHRKATPAEISLVQDLARRFEIFTPLPRRITELTSSIIRTLRLALVANSIVAKAAYALARDASTGVRCGSSNPAFGRLLRAANHDRRLAAVITLFRDDDGALTDDVHSIIAALTDLWQDRDTALQAAIGTLRTWLLPRSATPTSGGVSAGGLSTQRIANLRSFRAAQLAFLMRPRPHQIVRPRGISKPARRTFDVLKALRRERVRVLASRIIEAALGGQRSQSAAKRSPIRLFSPVDAIVIEESRLPSPPSGDSDAGRLLGWLNAELVATVTESAALHHLPVLPVVSTYGHTEDCRTGAPGVRARAIPIATLLDAPYWHERTRSAVARTRQRRATPYERLLAAQMARWNPVARTWIDQYGTTWVRYDQIWKTDAAAAGKPVTPPPIILPDDTGPLFLAVPDDPCSPAVSTSAGSPPAHAAACRPINAESNAAANIGLHVLLDRDWPAGWSHFPLQHGTPLSDSVRGSAAFAAIGRITFPIEPPSPPGIMNAWRRRTVDPIDIGAWLPTRQYFATIADAAALMLLAQNEVLSDVESSA